MAEERAAYEVACQMAQQFGTTPPRPEAFGLDPAQVNARTGRVLSPEVRSVLEDMYAATGVRPAAAAEPVKEQSR